MTYSEILKKASKQLKDADCAVDNARILMLSLSNVAQNKLYSILDQEIDFDEVEYFNKLSAFINGKPLHYILGKIHFYNYDFNIDERALIPRPETELLVEKVINYADVIFPDVKNLSIFDIATGSGIIGITLAKEIANSQVIASDICQEALDLASENNQLLQANVKFVISDMANYFVDQQLKADILVANPPYIGLNELEIINKRVLDHEPKIALFGGDDGLKYYRDILANAHKILKPKFLMAFEMGAFQKAGLQKLLAEFNYKNFKFIKDFSNCWRMLIVSSEDLNY